MKQDSYDIVVRRYTIGAVGSAVLLISTYLLVTSGSLQNPVQIGLVVMFLAFLQTALQLYTFLHIQTESKPRWKSMGFLFSALMIVVIASGSIWVMININYRMGMSPDAMQEFMIQQNKKGF